jgi:hypothetical protein
VDIDGAVDMASTLGVTGVATLASLVATTADINAGTIDNTVIGGTTAAAISGTTGQFATSLMWTQQHSNTGTAAAYNLLLQPVGGNVGIGVTPASKLHIGLTSSAAAVVNVGSFGAAGAVSLGSIANNNEHVYLGTGDANGAGIAAGIGFLRESSGWNSALAFYTNNVTSGPNGVSAIQEKMRIDAGGSLLIGKTTPADLHDILESHHHWRERCNHQRQKAAGGIDGITLADNAYIDC